MRRHGQDTDARMNIDSGRDRGRDRADGWYRGRRVLYTTGGKDGWYSERKDLNALPQKEREEEGGWRGREGHNQGMSVASSMAAGEAGALARQRSRGASACVSIPSTARFLFSRALWRSVISRSAMSSLRHSIPRVVSARASIVPPMPAMEDAIQHEERAGAACSRYLEFRKGF